MGPKTEISTKNQLKKLKRSLSKHKLVAGSAGWLCAEKLVHLVAGLTVSVVVADYLGPEDFGTLNYAVSVTGLLGCLTYLGLTGIVVRDITKEPEKRHVILGTAFSLKLVGSLVAYCIVWLVAWVCHGPDTPEFIVLVVVGLTLFGGAFAVIDLWFQSQTQSKYSVCARTPSLIVASVVKLSCVYIGAPLIAFAVATGLRSVLVAILLLLVYRLTGSSIQKWRYDKQKAFELLNQSRFLILVGLFAALNLQIDKVLLNWIVGPSETGIYSVAVAFSEIWYFVAVAISVSVFPQLIRLKEKDPLKYESRLQLLISSLIALAVVAGGVTTISASYLIEALYEPSYSSAAPILAIHVWGGVFVFVQQVVNRWVLIEGILKTYLAIQCGAALLNVFLNILLIPTFGGMGAAIATILSYAASAYLFLFVAKSTRKLAFKITRAFVAPLTFRNTV